MLPGSQIMFPYFIIGDGGFPLKTYLMRPYSRGINYGNQQKIFNYRLSRARRIIESAFGTLTNRWKIFESPLDWKLESSEIIILSTICMHNYLITDEMNLEEHYRRYIHTQQDNIDLNNLEEDDNDVDLNQAHLNHAVRMRNRLAEYFVSPVGEIPWQWERAFAM